MVYKSLLLISQQFFLLDFLAWIQKLGFHWRLCQSWLRRWRSLLRLFKCTPWWVKHPRLGHRQVICLAIARLTVCLKASHKLCFELGDCFFLLLKHPCSIFEHNFLKALLWHHLAHIYEAIATDYVIKDKFGVWNVLKILLWHKNDTWVV